MTHCNVIIECSWIAEQAELTRLAEATSRVSAWEFHKEAHGIKEDLERKQDEFFVTHHEPQWLSYKEAHVPDPIPNLSENFCSLTWISAFGPEPREARQ